MHCSESRSVCSRSTHFLLARARLALEPLVLLLLLHHGCSHGLDPLFKLANVCFEAIPPVLEATGKVKNPWPNVDALSGTCMQHYGLHQADYYTVVFAVSRSLGCMANLVWSRILGLPIERPKSMTLDALDKLAKK